MTNISNRVKLFDELGALHVSGTHLVDKYGNIARLRGISSIGIGWYPEYMCEETLKELRDKWNINLVRVTMYTVEDNGYCTDGNKEKLKTTIKDAVKCATRLGMYAIIDWHIMLDGNPHIYEDEAKLFFTEMVEYFKDYNNVFYEICNEPNGNVDWACIKSYANTIIPIIRSFDSDAVIMVGTPTWSQDVDIAALDPLEYDNLLYSLHFYAATHKQSLRDKMTAALESGLAVFVNEFSICDASGNGMIDYDEGNAWLDYLKQEEIGYCMWNLSRKNETSAVIKPNCNKLSKFTDDDISDIAKWFIKL